MERRFDVTRESFTALTDPADQRIQLLQVALLLAITTEKPLATRLGNPAAVIEYMNSLTPGSPQQRLNFDPAYLAGPGTAVLQDLAAPKAAIVSLADFLQGEYYNDPAAHRGRINLLLSKL